MAGIDTRLAELVQPIAQELGFELWGIEYLSHSKQKLVRIYIDSDQGIGVDDCASVSRQVGSVFDVEEPIAGEYSLEVSSPGMDRPLFKLEQYARYVGEHVTVRLRSPYEGRRKFAGQLNSVEGEDIVVAVDDHEYLLPFDMIDKANITTRF
jgi:ribosome maturation factor RimP